jgi:predicted small lipoprotein YifL
MGVPRARSRVGLAGAAALAFAAVAVLAACGQKGPLFLPPPNTAPQDAPSHAPSPPQQATSSPAGVVGAH